jgi:hypothetical protein
MMKLYIKNNNKKNDDQIWKEKKLKEDEIVKETWS